MTSIVALDLETTGLDPNKDSIIEIGAVRFNGRRVEAEWNTLIHPGKPIPPFIVQLTGITDQMVMQAPPIRSVLADLAQFVGDDPVLGHNVGFDLGFLRKYKILVGNEALDTYELASVLLPSAGRYNLAALSNALGVPTGSHHRALEDARATRGVYLRLLEEILKMPIDLLNEIVQHAEGLEWGAGWTFRQALRARTREMIALNPDEGPYRGPLFSAPDLRPVKALNPLEQPIPLDVEEAASILEHGGVFSRHFPHFEYRPQQVEMLRAVAGALSDGHHLLVEAGTGTGKSMAYLTPAALYATQNNTRVVISTNTINLQDQLINKDIPDLRQALGLDLRAAVLKGRSNYLCIRRLENLRRRSVETAEEMRVLAKVLVWMGTTRSGDRSEINLNGPAEYEVWTRLSAEDEGCTTENCIKRAGGACPFYKARQAAQTAHLLVVNHALLLADVATGNKVLPEYQTLIVDEAHHLENATTNALSYRVTQWEIDRLLRELGGPSAGALGWLMDAAQGALDPGDYGSLHQMVHNTADLAFHFDALDREFFKAVDAFLVEQREGRPLGSYSHQERILPATRTQPAWADVERAWDECSHTLKTLLDIMGKIVRAAGEMVESLPEEDEELFSAITGVHRRLAELFENMEALVFKPDAAKIYWVEVNSNGNRLALNAAPLHIGSLMEKYLWDEKTSVILTSATLTATGEFDYIRGRLNAENVFELALGSPFDYESAAMLYLADDIPEPSDRHGHQRAIEGGLINLCRATGGRTLALFTSYEQLKRTSAAIAPVLARHDIVVYEQGEGASAHSLLETFRNSERAVLLGTRSFWEGVDVPGQALSVLVIVKLPFDVPSDPIVAARSETFEDPFNEYSLPEAILRFRQGFGRLIRTQYDRGVVAILDRRILTKRYGKMFIESLPECTLRKGPISGLPQAAARWLNL